MKRNQAHLLGSFRPEQLVFGTLNPPQTGNGNGLGAGDDWEIIGVKYLLGSKCLFPCLWHFTERGSRSLGEKNI